MESDKIANSMSLVGYKSVTTLFKESQLIVRRNLWLFVFVNTVTIINIAWQIGTSLRDKTNGSDWGKIISNSILGSPGPHLTAGSGILVAILGVLSIILGLMAPILELRAAQNKKVNLSDIWSELTDKWLKLIAVFILTGLIIVVGLVALIIPGLYLMGRLLISPYVLIDQNTGVIEALNRSWEMTKGWTWSVLSVALFGIVLALPNVIPIVGPAVAFVLTVLYSVALPLRYLEIKKTK